MTGVVVPRSHATPSIFNEGAATSASLLRVVMIDQPNARHSWLQISWLDM